MQTIRRSRHARVRQQQRGIPHWLVRTLIEFGRKQHDGQGAIRYSLGPEALQRIARTQGKQTLMRVLEQKGAYVVVSGDDGTVITVGHRYH